MSNERLREQQSAGDIENYNQAGPTSNSASLQCVACCQPILLGATRCHECGTYQRRFRRSLPVVATAGAVVAYVLGIGALVLASATDFWQGAFPSGTLEVIRYAPNQLTVLNDSPIDILVESVEMRKEAAVEGIAPYAQSTPINEIVSEKSIFTWKSATGSSGAEFIVEGSEIDGPTELRFFSNNDSGLALLLAHDPPVLHASAQCSVRFRRSDRYSDLAERNFDCTALLVRTEIGQPP